MTKIVVIEIGKSIIGSVIKHLGSPYAVVSYPREVQMSEFKKILKEAYEKITDACNTGEEVWIILSGPLALIFQLGQLLADKKSIRILQYYNGEYHIIPGVSKDELMKKD